jgi:hypothetical protein
MDSHDVLGGFFVFKNLQDGQKEVVGMVVIKEVDDKRFFLYSPIKDSKITNPDFSLISTIKKPDDSKQIYEFTNDNLHHRLAELIIDTATAATAAPL